MKDQLISLETAILAKDKGFNIETYHFYDEDDKKVYKGDYNYSKGEIVLENWNNEDDNGGLCSAPTQSLLQRWLRESYNININCKHRPHNQKYYFDITGKWEDKEKGILKSYDFKSYNTYEEALEIALQESLKLIKNER